jgi:hypothetical protein
MMIECRMRFLLYEGVCGFVRNHTPKLNLFFNSAVSLIPLFAQ